MAGLVGGLTGDVEKAAIAGYATTGGKFTRKITGTLDNAAARNKIDGKPSRDLAAAYENYKMATGMTNDAELYNKSIDLMDADIDSLTDKNEIALATQLQNMRDSYGAAGEDDPKLKVMDKIEDIQNGKVGNNIVNVSMGSIQEKTRDLKDNSHMGNDAIMQNVDEILGDIQANGSDYLNSDSYKTKLSKREKGLAKEIYKAKEVLGAIGDVPDNVVNDNIKSKIEDTLNS